ncbi:cytochrome ubiquinol oxidase subunit I [Methylomonas sp. LL1]|uniref:cytochrome ubiquinol oxidase subunit I n=1 Tax=Methylomonas sp. LL1 TaxID=2785785 RepID=UPI0018C38D98|nr:cytochrome ubiquinol oxidase subunit I [Methylomonas sp. LL1]QPK62654.1 cytochrome ubiquinol oxidase subunit I [Methylomonas sp. LL1]
MISETVVELSRWQFAITAMLHFLFIPLTLGLALPLALTESAFVFTGKPIYQTMARFWGRIFAINFTLAVATRLVVVLQFGLNGSYFSHYVGDIFALPLAIEALTGFFLAAALFGPYWFGWNKLGKYRHLLLTWLIALAVNVSAYWILVANGWMQNPLAAEFNYQSYRMELTDFNLLLTNPAVLTKYLHTVAGSYATAAGTLMAISAYYLRKRQDDQLARLSFRLAAGLGLVAITVTVWLGDDTPNLNHPVQQAKRAAIHAEIDKSPLPGIETRIRSGITAYTRLQELRDDNKDPQVLSEFVQHKADLGYALLVTPWNKKIVDVKDKQISMAAQSALPAHPSLLFGSYRLMIACGIFSLILFVLAVASEFSNKPLPTWMLSLSVYMAPLPWLANICGWFVAEAGIQPWAVAGVLPTFVGVSSLSTTQLIISSAALVLVYIVLLGAGLFLMRQAILNRRISAKGVEQ